MKTPKGFAEAKILVCHLGGRIFTEVGGELFQVYDARRSDRSIGNLLKRRVRDARALGDINPRALTRF